MLSLVLLVIVAGCLLYRYIMAHYQMLATDGIPGPSPKPLIGNLRDFAEHKEDPLGAFTHFTQKYGKVFGYYEGWTPCIVVSDPAIIEQILVKKFHHFDGRPNCWPFQHGPESLALQNLNGELWKQHREVIATAFRTSNIRQMWPRLCAAAERYVENLERDMNQHPDGFDVVEHNESYSLEAFTSAAFDVAPHALRETDRMCMLLYMRATHHSAAVDNPAVGLARVYPSLVPFLKIFDSEHKRLATNYFEYMGNRLRQEEAKMSQSQKPTNLLQLFLCARKKHTDTTSNTAPSPFDLNQIQGMVSGLLGGGLGPASTALDFCLHCLSLYPQHQQTLLTEILTLTPDPREQPITMKQVQELQFLDMFVSECLRLFPVAPGVARTCCEDCVVGGVQFRKGTVVRLMGSVQYTDPASTPILRYLIRTEREKRHPYSFSPFGSGPRMCVAKRLGLLQVKIALIMLVLRFRVTACALTPCPLPLTFKPFLCPKNRVWVRLIPRAVTQ